MRHLSGLSYRRTNSKIFYNHLSKLNPIILGLSDSLNIFIVASLLKQCKYMIKANNINVSGPGTAIEKF